MNKVSMEIMSPWIANRITELLGVEDDIVVRCLPERRRMNWWMEHGITFRCWKFQDSFAQVGKQQLTILNIFIIVPSKTSENIRLRIGWNSDNHWSLKLPNVFHFWAKLFLIFVPNIFSKYFCLLPDAPLVQRINHRPFDPLNSKWLNEKGEAWILSLVFHIWIVCSHPPCGLE